MKAHLTALILSLLCAADLPAQSTFTYQGRLSSDGSPANGTYNLTFSLYITNIGGMPVNDIVLTNAASVSNGMFGAVLDFGNVFDGTPYWLEIGVATNGSYDFTILNPRQAINPVPYALHAQSASSLLGVLNDSQISNNVPRLSTPTNVFQGTLAATKFSGDGSGLTNVMAAQNPNALLKSNNGSDFESMALARKNLGGMKINTSLTLNPPNFPTPGIVGDYEGQVMRTKYGVELWWNGVEWRAEMMTPGVIIAGSTNSKYSSALYNNHRLMVGNGTDNVLELQNFDPERYSAVRFTDRLGNERGAIGYANTQAAVGPGDLYFESYGLLQSIWFLNATTYIGGMQKITGDFVWFNDGSTNNPFFRVSRQYQQTTVAGFRTGTITVTNNYTISRSNHTVFVSGISNTITLPTPIGFNGELHTIKLLANGTTATVYSPHWIDLSPTYVLTNRHKYVTVQSDGANWWIVGGNQ